VWRGATGAHWECEGREAPSLFAVSWSGAERADGATRCAAAQCRGQPRVEALCGCARKMGEMSPAGMLMRECGAHCDVTPFLRCGATIASIATRLIRLWMWHRV
jgi:hypothetical protein